MLPVQVQYWTLMETALHNRNTEALTKEANAINARNAQSNYISATASERTSFANLQNAATNQRNAEVNAYNAQVNAYNAATNRMNAETNAFNVYELGTQNAASERMKARAASSQAHSAAKQAGIAEQQYYWNTSGPGYDLKVRETTAKELTAEAAKQRSEAESRKATATELNTQSQIEQREHQNALYDAQVTNVNESTRRSKSEDTKGWFNTLDTAADRAFGRLLDVSDTARGWYDAITRRNNSNKEDK